MKTRLIALALVMLMAVVVTPFPAEASPYDQLLCPMVGGEFVMEKDQLWIDITKEDGKAVEKRREKIANTLDERSHDALTRRGRVTVEVHRAEGGALFVHWGTLADDE